MTDLALLRSRIAAFAANGPAPVAPASDWIATLLDGVSGQTFDALHLHAGQVCRQHGAAQDMIPHAARLHASNQLTAGAFYGTADHDPTLILFCAARDGDLLLIRSRSIPIDTLLALWHATV